MFEAAAIAGEVTEGALHARDLTVDGGGYVAIFRSGVAAAAGQKVVSFAFAASVGVGDVGHAERQILLPTGVVFEIVVQLASDARGSGLGGAVGDGRGLHASVVLLDPAGVALVAEVGAEVVNEAVREALGRADSVDRVKAVHAHVADGLGLVPVQAHVGAHLAGVVGQDVASVTLQARVDVALVVQAVGDHLLPAGIFPQVVPDVAKFASIVQVGQAEGNGPVGDANAIDQIVFFRATDASGGGVARAVRNGSDANAVGNDEVVGGTLGALGSFAGPNCRRTVGGQGRANVVVEEVPVLADFTSVEVVVEGLAVGDVLGQTNSVVDVIAECAGLAAEGVTEDAIVDLDLNVADTGGQKVALGAVSADVGVGPEGGAVGHVLAATPAVKRVKSGAANRTQAGDRVERNAVSGQLNAPAVVHEVALDAFAADVLVGDVVEAVGQVLRQTCAFENVVASDAADANAVGDLGAMGNVDVERANSVRQNRPLGALAAGVCVVDVCHAVADQLLYAYAVLRVVASVAVAALVGVGKETATVCAVLRQALARGSVVAGHAQDAVVLVDSVAHAARDPGLVAEPLVEVVSGGAGPAEVFVNFIDGAVEDALLDAPPVANEIPVHADQARDTVWRQSEAHLAGSGDAGAIDERQGLHASCAPVPVEDISGAIWRVLLDANVEPVDVVTERTRQAEVVVGLVRHAVRKGLLGAQTIGRVVACVANDAVVGVGSIEPAIGDVLREAGSVGCSVLVGGTGRLDGRHRESE